MPKKDPAVSLVVPMYNSEKYIGELLDSFLEQTFQDFEVIISDDNSTDNGKNIVTNYIPKFDGRLIFLKSSKNEGAGMKRNRGLKKATGKYVFFPDSDDVLTRTGLEEMYTLAEKFQADVIYCEKYYMSSGVGEEFKKNIHVADSRIQAGSFVSEPELMTDDLSKRIVDWLNNRFWVTPWLKFFSRNFLTDNKIYFQPLFHQNDVGQSLEVLLTAKRLVRVPNMCYVRRMRENSLSAADSVENHVKRWLEKTVRGLKMIDDFMSGIEFFKIYPEYKMAIFNKWVGDDIQCTLFAAGDIPPQIVYDLIRKNFKNYFGENETLISFLLLNSIALMKDLYIERRKNTPPLTGVSG